MLTNTKAKYIKSLQIKKYRKKHRSFLVEGAKNMLELLTSDYEIDCLVVTEDFHRKNHQHFANADVDIYIEKQEKINSISALKTNDAGLAVVGIPEQKGLVVEKEMILALDEVKDPGNLGTIIRTADWYGIKKIVASEGTAEVYNPKVIQACMGSFVRVEVYYEDLASFFEQHKEVTVLGAFLDGEAVQEVVFNLPAAVLMGNESNGISDHLQKFVSKKITIPRYGGAESLNVAISTAVICDNLIRNIHR